MAGQGRRTSGKNDSRPGDKPPISKMASWDEVQDSRKGLVELIPGEDFDQANEQDKFITGGDE